MYKTGFSTLLVVLGAISAVAQGVVLFDNKNIPTGPAPFHVNGVFLSGTNFSAQLYSAAGDQRANLGALIARETRVQFLSGADAGFVATNGVNAFTGTAVDPEVTVTPVANGSATVQMRAWESSFATYDDAVAGGGLFGQSDAIFLSTTGGGSFPAVELTGLQTFYRWTNITLTLRPGMNLVGHPYNSSKTLDELFSNIPQGTRVFRAVVNGNNISWQISTYEQDDDGNFTWAGEIDPGIRPGEGFFVRNPLSSNLVVNFLTEIPQPAVTISVPAGFSLLAGPFNPTYSSESIIPYSNFPQREGMRVFKYNPASGAYSISTYELDDGGVAAWSNRAQVGALEGFWLSSPSAFTFTRP